MHVSTYRCWGFAETCLVAHIPLLVSKQSLLPHTCEVLKLETAFTVSGANQTFLGRAGRERSLCGGGELLSARASLSYWLCRSTKGELPVCVLGVLGKSKFTLASSFSTSITHVVSRPNLSWRKPRKAWLHCHSRSPKLARRAVVPCLRGSALELRCPAGHL